MKIPKNLLRRTFLLLSPLLLATTMDSCLVLQFGGIHVSFFFDPPPTEINAYGRGDFDDYEPGGSFLRSIIYVGDEGVIYYSTPVETCVWDSSETVPGEPNLNDITLRKIGILNSNFIVGDNGTIYRKSDYSSKGVFITNPAGSQDLKAICQDLLDNWIVESTNVIAVGDSGTVIKSTDHGLSWSVVNFPYSTNLRTCHIRGDYILVSGENYAAYKSSDFGETWEQIKIGGNFNSVGPSSFNAIFFYDENVGYIGGPWGLMGKTTDSGANWAFFAAPDFEEINDLFFISPDSGVAVGTNGIVRFTADGGNTWEEDTMITDLLGGKTIKQIGVSDEPLGTVIGEDGLNIVFTTDSTLLSVNNEDGIHIHNYSLSNNYPNPFNSSTIIEYNLPQYGFVTLTIYDMLGREIATLVNEEKPSGNYKLEFDASDLASGIYYYHITVGNKFVETKKMVLLR